jgi:hypothetical protein
MAGPRERAVRGLDLLFAMGSGPGATRPPEAGKVCTMLCGILAACGRALFLAGALAASAGAGAAQVPPGQEPEPATETEPAQLLDAHRLRSVFLDLLGRPPFQAERERWLGKGQRSLLNELVGSREFWRQWYEEQLYYFLLIDNFAPQSERVLAIPDELARGGLDVREAIHRIALSSSFDQRNPGADTFVTVVMEQLTGMTVQKNARELEIGKAVYDGKPGLFLGESGSTQADILRIAVGHRLFSQTLLEREYRRWLRAEPDKRALQDWTREFQRNPGVFVGLVKSWFLSPGYDARLAQPRPEPNRLFVRAVFVDLCGRLPTPEEQARMRNALDGLSDPGPLRSVLARLLLDSGAAALPERKTLEDEAGWIQEEFLRLLGRPPSERELSVFTSALRDPACRPSTVIYALVSHPAYQTY